MIAAATLLTVEYLPLPWYEGEPLHFPLLYRTGVWTSLVLSAAFVGALRGARLGRGAPARRRRWRRPSWCWSASSICRSSTGWPPPPRMSSARRSPRSSSLVTEELQKSAPDNAPALQDDLALLAQEARRCREILRKLNSLGTQDSGDVLERAVDRDADRGGRRAASRDQAVEVDRDRGRARRPRRPCARNPGIVYGLGNLVENAVDFAQIEGADRRALDAQSRQSSSSRTTAPAFAADNSEPARRSLCERPLHANDAPRPSPTPASASAFSSPRRCSSAPAPRSRPPMSSRREPAREVTITWPRVASGARGPAQWRPAPLRDAWPDAEQTDFAADGAVIYSGELTMIRDGRRHDDRRQAAPTTSTPMDCRGGRGDELPQRQLRC